MVVRLKEGQFTAGDMIFMVRSRRRAKADPRFYGENAGINLMRKQPVEKKGKPKEIPDATPITNTVSISNEPFKESDDYFSLEEEIRQEPKDTLNERARKILTEIENDMKQINMQQSLKRK